MMSKAAETAFPIHDLLRERWSPRAFEDREVETQAIGSLLEAARWAASCYNEQPWSFLVATRDDPQQHQKMVSCLVDSNQVWAKSAPLLMLSLAKTKFERNGKPNRHAWHDVGLAVSQMTLQALSMDLYVHQMAGIHRERIVEEYELPEEVQPVAAIAIGYLGDPDQLPEKLADRERRRRQRKELDSFVFRGAWGDTAPVLEAARANRDLDQAGDESFPASDPPAYTPG